MSDNTNYIGKQFGTYVAIEQLSAGAYGKVYKGKHIILSDRPIVAIKILDPRLTSEEEKERFLQEARFLDKLKHPFILPIIDAGIEEELEFLITEFAPKGSLKDHLQIHSPNPLSIEDALNIISQVGQALEYVHQLNVVHRDLKPDNILFRVCQVKCVNWLKPHCGKRPANSIAKRFNAGFPSRMGMVHFLAICCMAR